MIAFILPPLHPRLIVGELRNLAMIFNSGNAIPLQFAAVGDGCRGGSLFGGGRQC